MKGFVLIALGLLIAVSMVKADEKSTAPRVTLDTSQGAIVLELYPDRASGTVENFLAYVNAGFYDGTIFHRVIDGFMIQGGGFTEEFSKKDTRDPIQNEADNGLKNDRGSVAMARTGDPHSATAQFFINTVDNDPLNHTGKNSQGWGYTVFGRVVDGMGVVDAIEKARTGKKGPFPQDVPLEAVIIRKATVGNSGD